RLRLGGGASCGGKRARDPGIAHRQGRLSAVAAPFVNRSGADPVDSPVRGFQTCRSAPLHCDPDAAMTAASDIPHPPSAAGGRVNTDLHIEVRGAGAPLVLLHGWAMHGGVFAPLVERLCDRFQLHLVDLPGHGRSRDSAVVLEPDAVVDAVAQRVPEAPWLGWSLGGMLDRKSTRLNSSHVKISYAVFCLKKKKQTR